MPPFLYEITFLDTEESQRFDDIHHMDETRTEYILVRMNGDTIPFNKEAIKPPVVVSFSPFMIDPPQVE